MTEHLIYQVAVGQESKLYQFCTRSVFDYCERHDIDYMLQTVPILKINPDPKTSGRSESASKLGYLPIFEKENALQYLGEYDQVAVIDADVWIRPDAPNIFDSAKGDFAAVVEQTMPINWRYKKKISGYAWGQYGDRHYPFLNMGVMVMNKTLLPYLEGQTPREFLMRPEFKDFVDGVGQYKWSTDQTLLNTWLKDCGADVHKLGWQWNGLYGALQADKIKDAHFVHFFLSDHLENQGEDVAELVKTL